MKLKIKWFYFQLTDFWRVLKMEEIKCREFPLKKKSKWHSWLAISWDFFSALPILKAEEGDDGCSIRLLGPPGLVLAVGRTDSSEKSEFQNQKDTWSWLFLLPGLCHTLRDKELWVQATRNHDHSFQSVHYADHGNYCRSWIVLGWQLMDMEEVKLHNVEQSTNKSVEQRKLWAGIRGISH